MAAFTTVRVDRSHLKRNEIFSSMVQHMDSHLIHEAEQCADHLLTLLPHRPLQENRVFVAFGGGKDSSFMVGFVRFIQLLVFQKTRDTFHLRIATNRHSGMPFAVMENIHRAYTSLGLYEEPATELLLIDGHEVRPFNVHLRIPKAIIERNRLDMLMTGHRCQGEARPTFCNACNLSMVNSFGVAAAHNGGVDVFITGDSSRELRAYMAWIRQVATKFGIAKQRQDHNYSTFLQTMNSIGQHYYSNIYGEDAREELDARRIQTEGIIREPTFFSIYRDTGYQASNHWNLLTRFLSFQFDDLAFSFTESDCANPALMAHLRGLKAEHIHGRPYEEGIAEYVSFATQLMRLKDFPEQLIQVMSNRYQTFEAIQVMRAKLNTYAQETLDLSEEQLVCMLYSPFAQQGKRLSLYLTREQPDLLPQLDTLHQILGASAHYLPKEDRQKLEHRLMTLSHLNLERLQKIYAFDLSLHGEARNTPIQIILARDPHKATVQRSTTQGTIVDIISGR